MKRGKKENIPVPPTTAIGWDKQRTEGSRLRAHTIKSKRKFIYTSVQMEDDGFLLSIDSVNLILFSVGLLQQTPPFNVNVRVFPLPEQLKFKP